MESKHKNALIGALLAVVFVMAVGYAAFAQTLTINGTASIDSSWDVRFDDSKTTGTPTTGLLGAEAPTVGTISYDDTDTTATISETALHQPGDKVTYELVIENNGTINATLARPRLTVTENGGDSTTASSSDSGEITATVGNIKYTVTGFTTATALDASATQNLTVTAEYIDSAGGNTTVGTEQSVTANIQISANQATA